MQNSNLSSKIFPSVREDWGLFIQKVENELQSMITTLNNDKQRIRNLNRIINKMQEIISISKDNIEYILNYKELFMYIDKSLESSFDALIFFQKQDNFDNSAVKVIYERIINSSEIIKMNSEYNRLTIKVQFDKERIKKLNELISGRKIDYLLIEELVDKYQLSDIEKKNILFYPIIMLSIKQNIKDDNKVIQEEKNKYYNDKFESLCKKYQNKKEKLKDLLVKCYYVRTRMNNSEISMYSSFVANSNEIGEYEFNNEIKFKIYTLALYKIKKDIESFIDGINDLKLDNSDLDDEVIFFQEMINEFENIAQKLNSLMDDNKDNSNVFLALDVFNRLIVNEDLLSSKNRNGIKALFQKVDKVNDSQFEDNHMLGVNEAEKLLNKNILILETSKIKLAYIMVDKNILIITGDNLNSLNFDKLVKTTINKNITAIRNQISLIKDNNLDYINLQNRIIEKITGREMEKLVEKTH